jgi:hypothetical protein
MIHRSGTLYTRSLTGRPLGMTKRPLGAANVSGPLVAAIVLFVNPHVPSGRHQHKMTG